MPASTRTCRALLRNKANTDRQGQSTCTSHTEGAERGSHTGRFVGNRLSFGGRLKFACKVSDKNRNLGTVTATRLFSTKDSSTKL